MSYCIYAITDPRTDKIFYIGQTRRYKSRCAQHKKGHDSLSGLTIRQIKKNGFVPLFIRLESCKSKQAALMAEIFWIELFRARGNKLTNCQHFEGYEERAKEKQKLEQIANGRPVRQGKNWSKREDKRLLTMRAKNMSHARIADRLGRSIAAVRMRLQVIDLQGE